MRFLNSFFIAIAFFLGACGSEATDARAAQFNKYLGAQTAALEVFTLDGEAVKFGDMAKLYGDKPVVLNVWATWCPPCLKELPSLDRLAATGDYTVIALATDKTAAAVQAYLQKQPWGANLKVLHDPAGRATYASIGARALPMTYILDKNLTVKGTEAGERDWDSGAMVAKIKRYLQ